MQINWYLVGLCVLIWSAGYCFGFQVGAREGAKQIIDKVIEIVEKLSERKEGF